VSSEGHSLKAVWLLIKGTAKMTYCSIRKTWVSRPVIALLLVAMVMYGCIAGRVTPPETTVKAFRTVAVVPVEAPPLTLYPETNADHEAVSRSGLKSGNLHYGADPTGITYAYVLFVLPFQAHASTRPRTGEVASMTEEPSPPWMPTIGLAQKAAELLQRRGMREAFVVEGYARLPIAARAEHTYFLDNYGTALSRSYNSDVSTIDYGARGVPQADAIVEVLVSNYSYFYSGLGMQVMVKLTDPLTKRVLGRVRNHDFARGDSVAKMLQNDGQPLKRLIETIGERLLIKCLRDLGLYGP
jgi:hypothetical protein